MAAARDMQPRIIPNLRGIKPIKVPHSLSRVNMNNDLYHWFPAGGVTTPVGFKAAAVACGIKQSGRPDLVLMAAGSDCNAAGVFTRNQVAAAPVIVDKETLAHNNRAMKAIVINAGNANASTGQLGIDNTRAMQRLAAEAIGCETQQVLVMSTGVIGVQLPMDRVAQGISVAAGQLSETGGQAAAEAIMTTDTRPKHLAVEIAIPGGRVRIGGMAKGAGMIHPNMATLLGVITTDAIIPAELLSDLLHDAVEGSFNAISIDGDTSTNDTVLLLANGASGVEIGTADGRSIFAGALNALCHDLAMMIVRDGEGATKFVEIQVVNAPTKAEARQIAATIATSPLVKTAFAGGDPNWGRIFMAAGRSGVVFDQNRLGLGIGTDDPSELAIVEMGTPTGYSEAEAAAIFAQPAFKLRLDLASGTAGATIWTCDFSHEYVTINADYRT
jgi:glutamate N-acetyltransferase / amino-acid N-acetyltransferase